jgi:hypothetical protein
MDKNIREKNVFVFWTGPNPMNRIRYGNIDYMKQIIQANVILVTPTNLAEYIVEGHPLHDAYEHLSFVHRADYLRTYFMHHHGGGYCDVKPPEGGWAAAFQDMIDNPDKYINGYAERHASCIAVPELSEHYKSLIGAGAFICRPYTPLTTEWYNTMNALLDTKLEALKKHPASHPSDCAEEGRGYPIEWNEMLGRIYHHVCYKYRDHILQTVPGVVTVHYK